MCCALRRRRPIEINRPAVDITQARPESARNVIVSLEVSRTLKFSNAATFKLRL